MRGWVSTPPFPSDLPHPQVIAVGGHGLRLDLQRGDSLGAQRFDQLGLVVEPPGDGDRFDRQLEAADPDPPFLAASVQRVGF